MSMAGLVVVVLASALVAQLAVQRFFILTNVENAVQDWEIAHLLPAAPQDDKVVIVAIREETLKQFPYRSPLDREFLSNLLKTIASYHPLAVGLDVLFDQPTEPAKDKMLSDTLRHPGMPLVVSYTSDPGDVTAYQLDYLNNYLPKPLRVDLYLDKDQFGTVRKISPGGVQADGTTLPSFARGLAAAAGVKTPYRTVTIAWHGRPSAAEPPFAELPAHVVSLLPPALLKKDLAGKVVLIGSHYSLEDLHRTPFSAISDEVGSLPGIVIDAHAVSQILDHRPSPLVRMRVNLAIALLLAAIGGALGVLNFHLLPRIFAALVVAAALWAAGAALFHYGQVMIGLVAPSLALVMSFSAADSLSGLDARRQRQFIQGAFARYVSPKVVEQLIADPDRMSLQGERRVMTYMFTDIANFTTMSEGMDSRDLARVLNAYLDATTEVVLRHEGMVDKFIGDAIFAIFNAPVDLPEHAERAVRCALALDEAAEAFRVKQNAEKIPMGITRIGIHTGPAVIGNFGSSTRFNYTAQGDSVNVASRLEALNKHFGTRISASGATRELCKTITFRPIASVVLKGKTAPIEVWEPLRDGEKSDEFLQRYKEAFDTLTQEPAEALPLFETLAAQAPGDPCVKLHVERLRRGERGAAVVMEEK
ncbi:MAG TPA: adenylate/guanylate cyclase domain-containing protein [Rhizomicrobium sp.]|nr:adenylate/guanylate cyclase domain-containing protein [Rhizomicrobium sp.]